LECIFGVAGKILMSRIQWNLLGKIWIQNVGDIDFKAISVAENSNKLQKTRFWKEKSVENGTGHTSWNYAREVRKFEHS